MENEWIQWLPANPVLAFLASISLNIIVAVSGVLPSAFLTGANIVLFGFEWGLLVSIIGEAAGAVVSFILYRYGFKKLHKQFNHKFLNKLKDTGGAEAILLVLLLRIVPFVPSGAVTLTAAVSRMGLLSFSLASTIGKIPSLFIEAYSVKQIFALTPYWQLAAITCLTFIIAFYFFLKKK
ncbi:TVP38/TMEM64 family protein [Pseudobacillus wudalianchiensis]|uniref:TVP38/TMEM64 family protein n=1 Tax=Pseudobacillus wudalianchiensis TaxID=1743143 RepID=UPI0008086F43|nr:VTT domain-containing protein [Bacillus wudalianchiensis]